MANDELYTPKVIFDLLGLEFDLDVASGHNEYIVTGKQIGRAHV